MVEEHHQDEGEQSRKFQGFEQWSDAKISFGVATLIKHSREFPEVKTSNETSHLQMPFLFPPFRWSTIFTVLLSTSPTLRGLVEGCAVRWGCRDGLQGLPLSGLPDFPPSVESEHRIVCRLAWQDAFCPTMVADSWTPAVLASRWGMGQWVRFEVDCGGFRVRRCKEVFWWEKLAIYS